MNAAVIVVPPMLGTRLRDDRGRALWGYTRNLFFGRPVGRAPRVVLDGLLEELPLVPGVHARDVHGGLIRHLCQAGGYRLDHDLFVLTYDWRLGVAHAAAELGALVDRVAAAGRDPIDVLALSSGGLVARDLLRQREGVRRVVYLGTPQHGTLEAMNVLQNGFKLVPWIGKRYPREDMSACQISYDLLPHPDDPVFVDARGRPVDVDLYDADSWRELGLTRGDEPELAARLAEARDLHRRLEAAPARHDAVVIGARHLPTRARIVVSEGRALVPDCWMGTPHKEHVGADGDGSVSDHSLRALPGMDRRRVFYVRPSIHHDLPSDRAAHRLALAALKGSLAS